MLQKTITACLFIILLSLSSTVYAADRGLYLGAQFGAVFAEKDDVGLITDMDFEKGSVIAVAIGYDYGWRYGHARMELEYAYRQSDVTDGNVSDSKVTDGEVQSQSLLLNMFYPFETGILVTPYIMGGLGAALVDIRDVIVSSTVFIDNYQTAFAYQTGAGIDLAVNDHLTVDLAYRYFGTADKEFENNAQVGAQKKFDFRYRAHNALLGLRYKF